jgi:hypothetical protein
MAVVVGSLRVNLGMESASFQSGADRARITLKRMQVDTQALQRATSGFDGRGMLQQLSQIAQQTAATGRPMQALAVQAADLGMLFGPAGIAIGAVAGLVLPSLTTALFGAGEEMLTVEDRVKALTQAVNDYRRAAEAAGTSSAQLQEDFGAMAAEADRAFNALAQLARGEAEQALRATTTAISEQFGELAAAVAEVTDAVSSTERAWALGSLMDDLGITEDRVAEAEALAQAILDIGDAGGPAEAAAAMQAALDALVAAKGPLEDMDGAAADLAKRLAEGVVEAARLNEISQGISSGLLEAVEGMRLFAGNLAAAQGPAAGLLATMQGVAAAAWDAARGILAQEAAEAGRAASNALGQTEDPRGNTGNIQDAIDMQRRADALARYGSALTGVATAAGGPNGAAAAVEEVATIAETLNVILADAGDPVAEWRQGLQDIAEVGLGGLGDALRDFTESGMKDFEAFGDALVATAADAVEGIVSQFAGAQIGGIFGGPIGGILGSLAGGLFGGLFGGGGSSYEGSAQQAADEERADLMREYHELMGHENYLRRQEIAGYDESNRALAKRNQALRDEAEAAAEAAAVAADNLSLQMQLLGLQGDEAGLRELQLAQITDETTRALQLQVWAQEDLNEATQEATRAIEEAVAAITPEDYDSQFAYDKAIALARLGMAPSTVAPATVTGAAASQAEQTAALSAQVSTLTSLVRESLNLQRQWTTNGLLVEVA